MFNTLYSVLHQCFAVSFSFLCSYFPVKSIFKAERIISYNVPATVKNTDGYDEFFTSPGLVCLVKAFLESFNDTEAIESQPAKNMSRECKHGDQETTYIDNKLEQFVNYHVFYLGVTVDDKV